MSASINIAVNDADPVNETALVANGFTDITTRKSKIATFWEDVSRDAEESSTEFWHHAASNKTQAKMLAGSVVGVSERTAEYAVAPFKLMGSAVASVNEFENSFNSDRLTDRSDYERQVLLFKYQAQHDGVKATARDFWGAVTSPVTTGFTATHNFGRSVFNVVQDSRTNPFTSGRSAGHFAVDSSTLLFSGAAALRAGANGASYLGSRASVFGNRAYSFDAAPVNRRFLTFSRESNVTRYGSGSSNNFSRFSHVAKKQSRVETLKVCETELKGSISDAQYKKLTKTIKKASGKPKADGIDTAIFNVKIEKATGNIHLEAMRPGYNGYQRMSHNITADGERKRVVQTAFDQYGNIVAQNPGATKNNLFDLKW